jgi:hypothetical protein
MSNGLRVSRSIDGFQYYSRRFFPWSTFEPSVGFAIPTGPRAWSATEWLAPKYFF